MTLRSPAQGLVRTVALRLRPRFAPNQILLGFALRAILSIALPLAIFRLAGWAPAGLYMALGALQITLAGSGGAYRDRVLGVVLPCLLLPETYLLGTQVAALWWVAAPVMFLLAFASGMLRVFGAAGAPLGLLVGATYLLGTMSTSSPSSALLHTGLFLAGCLWTLVLTLAAWWLRPYVALRRDVAAAIDAAATLLAALPERAAAELVNDALEVRARIETARSALGMTQDMSAAINDTLAVLYALLHLPSHMATLALDLAQLRPRLGADARALASFDAGCIALARHAEALSRALASGQGWSFEEPIAASIEALRVYRVTDDELRPRVALAVEALASTASRLREAARLTQELARSVRRPAADWLPQIGLGMRLRRSVRAIGTQLRWRSAIFRYALRIAFVAALAVAVEVSLRVPHGIWLPLTVLVIMQPDFGATLPRAFARAGGTLAGVVIAGAILVAVPWPAGREAAVFVLAFLMALTLRLRYGFFVACLTPLVVLLLALYQPGEGWNFVVERVLETAAGTVLAILGALLLWPAKARLRLPGEFSLALRAAGAYLLAAFSAAASGERRLQPVYDARRTAELAVSNAQAALHTTRTEPWRKPGERRHYLELELRLKRLIRLLDILTVRIEIDHPSLGALHPLATRWVDALRFMADSLQTAAAPPAGHEKFAAELPVLPESLAKPIRWIGETIAEIGEATRAGPAGGPAAPEHAPEAALPAPH
ncbi:MAG TPA: FUSC family protein [Gammaproteobacteria bacterium]|nr:FUSC family protein [Gammaproteobacteria bacterium]